MTLIFYFILHIFSMLDSPKVSLSENIPHLQIYKSCTAGHIYQSDYSDADWINRISMAAKSNTLIPCADICQLHGAHINWESNHFFLAPKDSSTRSWFILFCIYVRSTVLWYFSFQCFWRLENFKHHLWSWTHSHTHTPTQAYVEKLHRDYGEVAEQQPRPVHTKCLLAAIAGIDLVIISL